jgi:hypothetical protein
MLTQQDTYILDAYPATRIYRFVTLGYYYNYEDLKHYPSFSLLLKTQLNSIGLSVPHRKHITSPLRAQHVKVIYRFMTKTIIILNIFLSFI